MVEYRVRYRLRDEMYETRVFAASSGSALRWLTNTIPAAVDATIVG